MAMIKKSWVCSQHCHEMFFKWRIIQWYVRTGVSCVFCVLQLCLCFYMCFSTIENSLPVLSFPLWCAMRSYWPHLEVRDPIWADDWSHSPFIRRSPSWDFPEFSSAVRQMPGDLCTGPGIISLSPLSLVTDVALRASALWPGTQTEAGGTATLV